ncbi:endoplasmic reticulum metallopeptidase 1 [Drosophila mojavensis]|uniref:endoplasmic reticulum metallopeptidase 1 n=1 Tax=Drosophila mojavensis TaxID=7230 RepID=UPI001CD13BD2|nr:endoplasmic reticulum metallopeptidase 1 [Drosophila mojavensis]
MSDGITLISEEDDVDISSKIQKYYIKKNAKPAWYLGTGFVLFWTLLFFAVVLPFFYRMPTSLTIEDDHKGEFIGDRAYNTLNNLVNIGPRTVGSSANEVDAVLFLINELAAIRKVLLQDYFTMEVDIQRASGALRYTHMLNMYQGVRNIIVKLTPKSSTSESYLLVNSHYDTVATSPGAGDDGFMVATMLEVLRVMATTPQSFEHPVVFLFNGAEETAFQASHGFITQHKWAPNCKAVVNLDAAGSGGRDILFQSGPSNPWLVEYYKKHAKHPFATSLGEEIFQSGVIPSDTDFTAFVEHGKIPGLDIAQIINGYIYHTKYDRIDVIPRSSIQSTGDNVLSLVRGLANATELHNPQAYEEGHAVFFDFLGLFLISYSEDTGIILNNCVAVVGLVLVFVSLWRMSSISSLSLTQVLQRVLIQLILQIIALALGLALPLLIAYVFDSFGLSLTYFSSLSLLIGLYVCPALIGLSLPITIYYQWKKDDKLPCPYGLQLALHIWAILLSMLAIALTAYGLRSAYVFTILNGFYAVSLALNLLTTLHDRDYNWTGLVMACQVIPFLYCTYRTYLLLVVVIPMSGRLGSAINPDLAIAGVTALGTIFGWGFLIPLINIFRRPYLIVLSILTVTVITVILASSTDIGFPYRPRASSERVSFQHVRRVFYEYDGSIAKDESGYLISFQDRREAEPMKIRSIANARSIRSDCEKHMMCGVPLYDERWVDNRLGSVWLPREQPIQLPAKANLTLLSKQILESNTTARFEFKLEGPDHMSLFIQTYEDDFATLSNWSFDRTYLENPPAYPLSYHIYFTYGTDRSPLNFSLDISKPNGDFEVPLFQLGISGHYVETKRDALTEQFAASFPSYAALVDWPSSYDRYIF